MFRAQAYAEDIGARHANKEERASSGILMQVESGPGRHQKEEE